MFQKEDVDFAPKQSKAEPLNPFTERLKQMESGAESKETKKRRYFDFADGSKPAASGCSDSETPKAAEAFLKLIQKKHDKTPQTAEPMISEQGEIPSGSAQLATELENHARRFAYLLETTYAFLYEPARLWRPYTDKQLAGEWRYVLDSGETPRLLERFAHLCDARGISSDTLRLWLDELMEKGFSRADAEITEITVCTELQTRYSNIGDFYCGERAGILKHPWYQNGELAAQGTLERDTEGGVTDG